MEIPNVKERLSQQLRFVAELDKLKNVLRRNPLSDGSRRENSAEHSWHLSMLAVTLAEYANEPVDILHVVNMLLIHDLVEIDAGDTFCYDEEAKLDKEQREQAAAERIFGMLPEDQAKRFRALWDEFEAAETPASKFANALDRLQPLLLNYHSGGGTWREYDVPLSRVLDRVGPIRDGSKALWQVAERLLDDAVQRGLLKDDTGQKK